MIKYVKRKDLDVIKYDYCIENSLQSRMYAFSWYLDIVADNWDVLVLDDYKTVMPIPWRKKYGIKYVYLPLWLLELGVFSLDDKIDYKQFFNSLKTKFKFVESRLNTGNLFFNDNSALVNKQMQILAINKDYELIYNNFRKDRKKDLLKSHKVNLTQKWNDNPKELIKLFKNNVGKQTPFILKKDYIILEKLIKSCLKNRVGKILSIYDENQQIVASGFFLKHKKTITILVSSTDFKLRKNGANTFLIDRAIFKFEKDYEIFNFGGSSIKTIADYFLSFGAETQQYQQLKYNNLPLLLKLFKK